MFLKHLLFEILFVLVKERNSEKFFSHNGSQAQNGKRLPKLVRLLQTLGGKPMTSCNSGKHITTVVGDGSGF